MYMDVSYDKSYALAVNIVRCCQRLADQKREFVLSKQLLRSGTSIAANLAEGNAAISDADLSNKISISYKESQETKYWLNLLRDTGYIEASEAEALFNQADEVSRILFATIRTLRLKDNRATRPKRTGEKANR